MGKIEEIKILYEKWSGEPAVEIKPFPLSGSNREYYRVIGRDKKAIAAYNPNRKENEAFVYLTRHFKTKGLPVPELYSAALKNNIYLLEDLGGTTLFKLVIEEQKQNTFSPELINIYQQVIDHLIRFQVEGHKGLDYTKCYPAIGYNLKYIKWDLNYFKYYFLKLLEIDFDESTLEDDFEEIENFLIKSPGDFFMYRDFQSRNILINKGNPYFVDYQGGRKGPLPYDLASLLFQARANISEKVKNELLEYYLTGLEKYIHINKEEFKDFFYGFAFIRIMQTLGAYGYRGLYERKAHFIQSMAPAIKNMVKLCRDERLILNIPYLKKLISETAKQPVFNVKKESKDKLTIVIKSFSYKKTGIPVDFSEHGGGFVFDCRALPNPGREEKYRKFSGKDHEVIDFFKENPETEQFINHVNAVVGQSIDNYLERGFDELSVFFGCTGGQHRSVYCAEKLAARLRQKYDVDVIVTHMEEGMWRLLK